MALANNKKQVKAITGLYEAYSKLYEYRNSPTKAPSPHGLDVEMSFVGVVYLEKESYLELSSWTKKESNATCERKDPVFYKQLENKVSAARDAARGSFSPDKFNIIDSSVEKLALIFLQEDFVTKKVIESWVSYTELAVEEVYHFENLLKVLRP